MSMSMRVVGIRPPTDEYKKKVAAYVACEAAGVEPPEALVDFFDGVEAKYVDPNGMQVDLYEHPAVKEYQGDAEEGFDVNLADLPEGVTILRFMLIRLIPKE